MQQYINMDNFTDGSKYPLTQAQLETLGDWDRSIRFDINEIIDEWRVVDLLCEVADLAKELALVEAVRNRIV